MSAVAGGQPTGHFHIQFVESGQPHPEAWAEGGGEPPDPCRQTVGGGLSCSFLPVPLEGGDLTCKPQYSRAEEPKSLSMCCEGQRLAGRGDLKLTCWRGEDTG